MTGPGGFDAVGDTSAWIEYLTGSALGVTLAPELRDRVDWLVPTIAQLEPMKWLPRVTGISRRCRVCALFPGRGADDARALMGWGTASGPDTGSMDCHAKRLLIDASHIVEYGWGLAR